MESEQFSNISIGERACDICYDDECEDSLLIVLNCCNRSKKICISCINCLNTPICPYCRKLLDSSCVPFMNEEALLSSSEPTTTAGSFFTRQNFLSQENIIDPSLYHDSGDMRRMMRRLRYQDRQVNTNHSRDTHRLSRVQRRNYHRQQRENNRNIVRSAMNLRNEDNYMDGDFFFMD